jgi:SAM-dependent methyltransferase
VAKLGLTVYGPALSFYEVSYVKNLKVRDSGYLLDFVRSRPNLKRFLSSIAEKLNLSTADWVRDEMYRRCFEYVRSLDYKKFDTLEISAGPQWAREFKFNSYTETHYPDYDICAGSLDRQFDLIIADQVFEHLPSPLKAAKNVYSMLRPGGIFLIATPFLLRVHNVPIDCTRWTETGLSYLLQDAGFKREDIETHSWGNRSCVKANFKSWRKRGMLSPMYNEPNFPVMVWAFARRI